MDNPYKAINQLIKSKDWDYRLNYYRNKIKSSILDEQLKSELAIQIVNQDENGFLKVCKDILRVLFKNNPLVGFAIHYTNSHLQSIQYKVFKSCISKHGETITRLEELFFDSGIDVNSGYQIFDCDEFVALLCGIEQNEVHEIINSFEFNYHNIRLLQFEKDPSSIYRIYIFEFSKRYIDFFIKPGDYLPLIKELKDFQIEFKYSIEKFNEVVMEIINQNNRLIKALNM